MSASLHDGNVAHPNRRLEHQVVVAEDEKGGFYRKRLRQLLGPPDIQMAKEDPGIVRRGLVQGGRQRGQRVKHFPARPNKGQVP